MHQPQLKTRFLLHPREELLQIWFQAISEFIELDFIDRFFIPTLVQTISLVKVEIFNAEIFSTLTQDIF